MKKPKLIRVTTVPISMNILLKNQLKFMSDYFDVIGITSYDKKNYNEVEKREGIRLYSVNFKRNISPFKDIIALLQLIWIFIKEKPEIVHSLTPKAGLLSMIAARITGIPIRMHTFTGLIFPTKTGVKRKMLILTDQILCWAATNINPEGEGVKTDLMKYNITKKPLKIIANGNVNGIDLNYFSKNIFKTISKIRNDIRSENNIEDEDIVFCFVGRFARDKGINELTYSFLELYKKYNLDQTKKNICLFLIGMFEPNDMPSKECIASIESNSAIKMLGRFDDIRPYLIASDVLVLPSYREGFPNSVLQAGAMELPSIVTDINGCNEIITDKENGIIIPVKNSVKLIEAMDFLINNDQKRIDMGKKARQVVIDKYEQNNLHLALLHEYKALLKEKTI